MSDLLDDNNLEKNTNNSDVSSKDNVCDTDSDTSIYSDNDSYSDSDSDNDSYVDSDSDHEDFIEKAYSMRKRKFSCWDVLKSKFMEMAYTNNDDWIYVHEKILKWITAYIDKHLLNKYLRATVEEVHHHNLRGRVYLIKLFSLRRFNKGDSEVFSDIKIKLTHKMPWKTQPTYFLRMNAGFKDQKVLIMDRLKDLNVLDRFKTTQKNVNWLYIPEIEIYEFFDNLHDDQIEGIFVEMSESQTPIYICEQFLWHQKTSDYKLYPELYETDRLLDMDHVAMDMCVEEWNRYDLLKDITIEDILRLDLANKYYSDPYFNVYLNRYLEKLLEHHFPQLFNDSKQIVELPSSLMHSPLAKYFISKFYHKIYMVYDKTQHREYFENVNEYGLLVIETINDPINLEKDQPLPETLLSNQHYYTNYNITNYDYFCDGLFQALLNRPVKKQNFTMNFDNNFNFDYESNFNIEQNHLNNYQILIDSKHITVTLKNCIESKADQLAKFVTYLIKLFATKKKSAKLIIEMWFINLILDDFTFLDNIETTIDHIGFEEMEISSRQIYLLSNALSKIQGNVTFSNCKQITDNDVLTLVKNIDLNVLRFKGKCSCTPLIYYQIAEHLMEKNDINIVAGRRIFQTINHSNMEFPYKDILNIEFFKDDCKIVARSPDFKCNVDLIFYGMSIYDEEFYSYDDAYIE